MEDQHKPSPKAGKWIDMFYDNGDEQKINKKLWKNEGFQTN
jgi:hypothetical protein